MASERDYPTEDELKQIAKWDYRDPAGWFDFISKIWWMADWGWGPHKTTGRLYVSTGGWSGNEDIIGAMRENFGLWSQHFYSVRTGGHYIFKINFKKYHDVRHCRPSCFDKRNCYVVKAKNKEEVHGESRVARRND